MIYSAEVQHMCPVAKGAYHGPAPIPEEGKWVQAKQIAVPMLFLQGKRDFQVHQRHLELWKTALSGRPDCQFILYDELNHLLQPGTGTPGLAEYATPSRVPEKVADDIAAFIRQHTVAH